MQALILAAGMGKRLGRYTKDATKCMVQVNGKTLIEYTIESLIQNNIKKLIIVVGYKSQVLIDFIASKFNEKNLNGMEIVFIENKVYDKTNNIYSLYLACNELIKDDTILLESDLIYKPEIISKLISNNEKNLAVVSKFEPWMDGTCTLLDEKNNITGILDKDHFNWNNTETYYKTVNIYKFSSEFSKQYYVPFLEAYQKAFGKNEYYEQVLKVLSFLSSTTLKGLPVSGDDWYEIDDPADLQIAENRFATSEKKLEMLQKRYGGYWRFENVLDYCYLVNPYFPPKAMIDKINSFSTQLITQYPSGQGVQCINAGRLFDGLEEEFVCVGNGAAELINSLGRLLNGKMYVSKSAFNEYIRCFKNCEFNIYDMYEDNYGFNVQKIIDNIDKNDIICIVNPDNPTGAFINYDDAISIVEKCNEKNKIVIFDESFIDFAQKDIRYTFLTNDILNKYKNLIVVKSISKSYGVPGVRLGVLASSNVELINKIKSDISIWNINSYGEYFLQIANLYKKEYVEACDKIAKERERFIKDLKNIKDIVVYHSEANYVLCDLGKKNSTEVASKLLEENIFIKDLRTKSAFKDMNYIRLAIRTEEENKILSKRLCEILEEQNEG